MANAEQFGHLSLPLVKPLSILSLSLSLSLCVPPQITIIAAIGGPTAPSVPSFSVAAIVVVVACSRYNESCHLARPPARSHLSIPPSRPPSRCIVQLLSWERRDLLLAFEMIMPSRPRDTDGQTEKERQKEDSHCGRKNKLNEGTKRPAASRAMNMDEISSCHSYLETVAFLRQLLTFAYPYEFCFKREE